MAKYNVLNDEYKELELCFNGLAFKSRCFRQLYFDYVEDYFREDIDYKKIDRIKRRLEFIKTDERIFKNKWGYIFKDDKDIVKFLADDFAKTGEKLEIKTIVSGTDYPYGVVIYEDVPRVLSEYLAHRERRSKKEHPLIENPIKILKEIASIRKNLVKDYDNFLKYKDLVSDMAYGNLFINTFNYHSIYIDDDMYRHGLIKNSKYEYDPLFKQITANIKDQEMKTMKTNFKCDWPDYYDESWGPDPNMIDFMVVTDYPIDENHRYTKKEIDKLLEDKKIIIVGFDGSYLRGEEYAKAEKYPKSPNIYDYWWAQPLAISYIRNDEKLNKQMIELIDNYKAETKEIMHDIFKVVVNIYEKQKEHLKKTVKEELEKEEIRHNNKTKEIKEQKTTFENNKKELDELLMEM